MLTIQDLIKQKDEIQGKRNKKYTLETTLGEILVHAPTAADVADAVAGKTGLEINGAIIYSCCEQPNLHDETLQKEFGVFEPSEIVQKLFNPGEIMKLGDAIFGLSGYSDQKVIPKLYSETQKN